MKNTLKMWVALPLLALVALAVLLTSCTAKEIEGSGKIAIQNFSYADFTKVRIGAGFKADLAESSSNSIEVAIDDNLLKYVNVGKNGEWLEVGMRPGSYHPSQHQATIMMPSLNRLELSDGSKVTVSSFDSNDELSAVLSDGSHLSGSMAAGNVNFALSDGSRVDLEGSAKDLKIISTDGSRINLEKFAVSNSSVQFTNGGTSVINVAGSLDARVSNGSHVQYVGNPTLGNIRLTGGATLSKKE